VPSFHLVNLEFELAPGWVLRIPPRLDMLATVLAMLGPVLCLEMGPKLRSSGILLWAVALQVSALVIASNTAVDQVRSQNLQGTWSGLLIMASVPLFLIFLQRLARSLERPDLEKKARSILRLLVGCLCAVGLFAAASLFAGSVPQWAYVLLFGVAMLCGAIFLGLFLRFFSLIRALQAEIAQRL